MGASKNKKKSSPSSKSRSQEPKSETEPSGGLGIMPKLLSLAILPYIVGLFLSPQLFSKDFLINALSSSSSSSREETATARRVLDESDSELWDLILDNDGSNNQVTDILAGVSIVIHRNGEPKACTSSPFSSEDMTKAISKAYQTTFKSKTKKNMTKYQFDHLLTKTLALYSNTDKLVPAGECGAESPPPGVKVRRKQQWGRGENYKIPGSPAELLNFCDMGVDHTPILPDHKKLKSISFGGGTGKSLPCHFHTREGLRISSLTDLVEYSQRFEMEQAKEQEDCNMNSDDDKVCKVKSLQLYAVPAGRVFMFAPSYIGEIFNLDHVQTTNTPEKPVYLEVLSLSPRVFDLVNYYSEDESAAIVEKALTETSETHRIKRSSTGASGYNVNSQRTSENGFDTHGATAMVVKKRSFNVLGLDEYHESFADGLQVLRYNKTTAYIPHLDWIDDPGKREEHDYFSGNVGTNRFATIFLYMSDVESGGETVFSKAWPADVAVEDRVQKNDALRALRDSGEADFLTKGSWQEGMVADCRSKLAVTPRKARSILFYSQHPNGEEDHTSLHGGCPVLSGTKWAANLWVWNGPRLGYEGSPRNPLVPQTNTRPVGELSGIFKNTGKDPAFKDADLYFEDTFWGKFSHGSPTLTVNTYEGHQWNVKRKSDGGLLKRWVVGKAEKQVFEV